MFMNKKYLFDEPSVIGYKTKNESCKLYNKQSKPRELYLWGDLCVSDYICDYITRLR